jgi:membrane protein implicated in regulation of membrane protease activity
MSEQSIVLRLLPPVALGALATIAGGYATNELTGDGPSWWWAVVGAAFLGLVVTALWVHWVQSHARDDRLVQPSKSVSQTAGDGGANVSISADNNSVAAWSVDTLNLGGPPDPKSS